VTRFDTQEVVTSLERAWGGLLSDAARWIRTLAASDTVVWCVVAGGVLLRVARYLDNRSLWLDESFLALNILEKSTTGLFGRLDYLQAAPPGFLVLEKLTVELVGDSEQALRLLPLIAGIVSLFLFRAVARRFLSAGFLLLAMILFAVNEPLIYYSSEVKPYSSDVLVALTLLLLACRVMEREHPVRDYAVLAAAGVLAVWLSYPAVLMLAGVFAAMLARALRRREWREIRLGLVGLGFVWLVSFAVVYIMTSENTGPIADAIFGTGETHSGVDRLAIGQNIKDAWGAVVDPGGFERGIHGLAALLLLFGVSALARHRHELDHLALLTLPLIAAFGAGVLDRYPLGGRFSLFLVPLGLILISRGVQDVAALSRHPLVLALPIAAFLVVPQTADAVSSLRDPPAPEHIRPLLRELVANAESGDVLYVYRNAQYALRYYSACKDCEAWSGRFPWPLRTAESSDEPQAALESVPPLVVVQQASDDDQVLDDLDELEQLPRGKRIWFLFSHVPSRRGLNEETLYLAYLDKNGRRIDESRTDNAAALYLYELSRPPPPS